MNSKIEQGIRLLKTLESLGKGEAYLVGGCVRDFVMGIDPHDIDVATNIPMSVLEEQFETTDIGKNKDFGIVVLKFEDEWFEVAQFRTEENYTDGRHPDIVTFVSSIEADLSRRDFTMNAMAMDADKTIIDPYDGYLDIRNGILRAVGNPFDRMKEDDLRALRALRFASRFGFEIEYNLMTAVNQMAEMFQAKASNFSQERFFGEIEKASNSWLSLQKMLILMVETGFIEDGFENIENHLKRLNVESNDSEVNLIIAQYVLYKDSFKLAENLTNTKDLLKVAHWLYSDFDLIEQPHSFIRRLNSMSLREFDLYATALSIINTKRFNKIMYFKEIGDTFFKRFNGKAIMDALEVTQGGQFIRDVQNKLLLIFSEDIDGMLELVNNTAVTKSILTANWLLNLSKEVKI